MFPVLLRVVVICVAVMTCWNGVYTAATAAADLTGCYLGSETNSKTSAIAQIVGHNYTTVDHNGLRYSVCVCCNVTMRDTNVSVEATAVAGGKQPTVFGRRNCSHVAATDRWVLLEYRGGDPYLQNETCAHGIADNSSTVLVFTCHSETSLDVIHADNCSLFLELRSPLSCGSSGSHVTTAGLSHGSVFCILFATLVGTYFLVGICYRRLVHGAKGIDQLPNKDFWVNLGHLQADGCNLVCRHGESASSRTMSRSDGWQQIAGGSFTDSDRDDAPLQP